VTTPANSYQVAGAHYTSLSVEPWDVIDTWPREQRIGFYRGNVLKYLMRARLKKGNFELQDFKKAQHYLQKLIEVLQEPLDN